LDLPAGVNKHDSTARRDKTLIHLLEKSVGAAIMNNQTLIQSPIHIEEKGKITGPLRRW
jgi:arsenate reductase-like glutaredoxin family protein